MNNAFKISGYCRTLGSQNSSDFRSENLSDFKSLKQLLPPLKSKFLPFQGNSVAIDVFGKWLDDQEFFRTAPVNLFLLKNIVLYNGFLFFSNGDLILESMSRSYMLPEAGNAFSKDKFRHDFVDVLNTNGKRVIGNIVNGQIDEVLDSALVCFNQYKDNFFHWHLQCLASAWVVNRNFIKFPGIFLFPEMKPWQKESLCCLNDFMPEVKISNYKPNNFYHLEQCYLPTNIFAQSQHTYWRNHPEINIMFDSIKKHVINNFTKNIKKNQSKFVYISRANIKNRILSNEHELIRLLTGLGVNCVQPEKLSYFEQVSLFSNCQLLIASAGAALTNIFFLPKTSQVIEIQHKSFANAAWSNVSRCCDIPHFIYLEGGERSSLGNKENGEVHVGPWSININSFFNYLKIFF
jgi:capsular polysaccharide biosynthesis protein